MQTVPREATATSRAPNDMADATETSRPPRPLPSGWSDSSDDGNHGNGAAETGGFDDSSSDGGWGGRGGGGGGMRAFERSSAERTRRALLENDEKLYKPPKLPLRQQQQQQQQQQSGVFSLGGDSDGSQPGEEGAKHPAVSLRYVPGDPFANEEADVGAWAKHFTYLLVVPRNGAGGEGEGAAPEIAGGSAQEGGSVLSHDKCLLEEPPSHHIRTPPDMMEMEERSDERGTDKETKRHSAPAGEAAAVAVAAAAEAASTETASRYPTAITERETPLHGGEPSHRDQSDQEAEEVFASHGVYEEYLAYDCRPPGAADETDSHDDGGRRTASVGDRGALVGSTTAATETAVASSAENGGWMTDKLLAPDDAAAAAAASQKGAAGRPRPRRLDTPQREVRQDIMDRLFDELWGRITPELLQLVQPAAAEGTSGRGGGVGGGGAAGVGLGSPHRASRDGVED